jgi:phosphoglycerol transferase
VLAGAILVWCLDLGAADLRVPLRYDSDSPFTLGLVKGLVEQGWFLQNPRLGAPFGFELYDFPYPHAFHFVLLRLLLLAAPDAVVGVNVYWLLGFPLIAVSAYLVLTRLGFPRLEALVAAELYAFLPGHLARGESHLFLSAYFLVPPAIGVALALERWPGPPAGGGLPFSRRAVAFALILCVLLGSAGAYYAFFSCFFFGVAGCLASLRTRRLLPLLAALVLVLGVGASVLVNLAPSLRHWSENGRNPEVAVRGAGQAEVYGLKLAQLLLPVRQHRLDALASLRERYRAAPLVNENDFATLGGVMGAGFLGLLLLVLAGRRPSDDPLLDGAARLNLAGTLLGTIGGFGSLVALFFLPQIRCYNRVSVFLAFFSLIGLLVATRPLRRRLVASAGGRALSAAALAGVLALGLLDQVSPAFRPHHGALRAQFESDRRFVEDIERSLPAEASVFQLPYCPYPEGGCTQGSYTHLRAYLHSRALRWSFPAMRGRTGASWQVAVSERPPAEMVRALSEAGFAGIWIDRRGYPDAARSLESALTRLSGRAPRESRDGHLLFFPLPFVAAARAGP